MGDGCGRIEYMRILIIALLLAGCQPVKQAPKAGLKTPVSSSSTSLKTIDKPIPEPTVTCKWRVLKRNKDIVVLRDSDLTRNVLVCNDEIVGGITLHYDFPGVWETWYKRNPIGQFVTKAAAKKTLESYVTPKTLYVTNNCGFTTDTCTSSTSTEDVIR